MNSVKEKIGWIEKFKVRFNIDTKFIYVCALRRYKSINTLEIEVVI